uniref:Uncharacterized protein n=1 Tax=Mantoniella antarctica TaxID=81844 RepID=A0A7S0XGA9_9CHLO
MPFNPKIAAAEKAAKKAAAAEKKTAAAAVAAAVVGARTSGHEDGGRGDSGVSNLPGAPRATPGWSSSIPGAPTPPPPTAAVSDSLRSTELASTGQSESPNVAAAAAARLSTAPIQTVNKTIKQPSEGSTPAIITAPAPNLHTAFVADDSAALASTSAVAAAKAIAAAAGTGPPVDILEMVGAHDELINVILEEEEEVVASHRQQIEATMELVKREMALLADVDRPGSAIDVYVDRLAEVLARKAASIADLQERVARFQAHLREEEVLSRTVGLH